MKNLVLFDFLMKSMNFEGGKQLMNSKWKEKERESLLSEKGRVLFINLDKSNIGKWAEPEMKQTFLFAWLLAFCLL